MNKCTRTRPSPIIPVSSSSSLKQYYLICAKNGKKCVCVCALKHKMLVVIVQNANESIVFCVRRHTNAAHIFFSILLFKYSNNNLFTCFFVCVRLYNFVSSHFFAALHSYQFVFVISRIVAWFRYGLVWHTEVKTV